MRKQTVCTFLTQIYADMAWTSSRAQRSARRRNRTSFQSDKLPSLQIDVREPTRIESSALVPDCGSGNQTGTKWEPQRARVSELKLRNIIPPIVPQTDDAVSRLIDHAINAAMRTDTHRAIAIVAGPRWQREWRSDVAALLAAYPEAEIRGMIDRAAQWLASYDQATWSIEFIAKAQAWRSRGEHRTVAHATRGRQRRRERTTPHKTAVDWRAVDRGELVLLDGEWVSATTPALKAVQ